MDPRSPAALFFFGSCCDSCTVRCWILLLHVGYVHRRLPCINLSLNMLVIRAHMPESTSLTTSRQVPLLGSFSLLNSCESHQSQLNSVRRRFPPENDNTLPPVPIEQHSVESLPSCQVSIQSSLCSLAKRSSLHLPCHPPPFVIIKY